MHILPGGLTKTLQKQVLLRLNPDEEINHQTKYRVYFPMIFIRHWV
jgi:hypothetical protein